MEGRDDFSVKPEPQQARINRVSWVEEYHREIEVAEITALGEHAGAARPCIFNSRTFRQPRVTAGSIPTPTQATPVSLRAERETASFNLHILASPPVKSSSGKSECADALLDRKNRVSVSPWKYILSRYIRFIERATRASRSLILYRCMMFFPLNNYVPFDILKYLLII